VPPRSGSNQQQQQQQQPHPPSPPSITAKLLSVRGAPPALPAQCTATHWVRTVTMLRRSPVAVLADSVTSNTGILPAAAGAAGPPEPGCSCWLALLRAGNLLLAGPCSFAGVVY
jgi:hypothetical protein